MAGAFLSQLQKKLLTGMPETCRLPHSLLQGQITPSTVALHPTALLALASFSDEEAVQLAFDDSTSEITTLKRAALWTLGRLLVSDLIKKTKIAAAVNVITTYMSDSDDLVRKTAINAAADAIPITREFDAILLKMAETADQEVQVLKR